jgi:hypothetical protein
MRWRNSDEIARNPGVLRAKTNVLMVASVPGEGMGAFERNRQSSLRTEKGQS